MADTKTDSISAETSADFLYASIGATLPIQLMFIGGRYWVKKHNKASLEADDWIMGVGSVAALILSILGLVAHNYSRGNSPQELDWKGSERYGQLSFGFNVIFPIAVSLPKFSLSVTYIKLFPTPANIRFSYILMAIVAGWCAATICTTIFQCLPVTAKWTLDRDVERSCINIKAALLSTAAINTVTDVAAYIWPTRTVWHVQLPLRQRIGLLIVFSAGSIVCVAGIVRMWYVARFYTSDDQLHLTAIVWVVSVVQANIGVVCGCLHSIKALLGVLFPSFFGGGPTPRERLFSWHHNHKNSADSHRSSRRRTYGFGSRRSEEDVEIALQKANNQEGITARKEEAAAFEAWATGGAANDDIEVPAYGIACTTEVVIDRGSSHSLTPGEESDDKQLKIEDSLDDLILPPAPARTKNNLDMAEIMSEKSGGMGL